MIKAVDDWKTEWFANIADVTHEGVAWLDSLDVVNSYYRNQNSNVLVDIDDIRFVGLGDNNCPRNFGFDVIQQYIISRTDGSVWFLGASLRYGPPHNGLWLLDDEGNTISRMPSSGGSEWTIRYQEANAEALGLIKMIDENSGVVTMEKDYHG